MGSARPRYVGLRPSSISNAPRIRPAITRNVMNPGLQCARLSLHPRQLQCSSA